MIERLGLPRLDKPGAISLVVATWIDATGRGLFIYFYLLYLTKDVGFELSTAGLVLSITGLLGLGVTPLAGSLVDRIGSKTMLVASQIAMAIGYAGLFFVPDSVSILLLTTGFITIGECIFWVGYPTLVSQIASEGERDRWFAFMGMARTAGIGLGGLIAAGVIGLLATEGYRVLLAANVCTYAIAAALIGMRVPAIRSTVAHIKSGGWMSVVRDRVVMKMALAHGFGVLAILIVFQGMPLYIVDVLDLPQWLPGIMLVVNTFILAAGQSLGLKVVAGWRRTRVYVLSGAGWIVGAVLFATGQIVPGALLIGYMLAAMAISSLAEVFFNPLNGSVPTTLAPEALRGRYLALFSLVWTIAGIISPTLVSGLLSAGGTWLWAGMAVAAAMTAGVALYAEQTIDSELQRVPSAV